MENRVYNFNPGPAALPEEVLVKAREELLNYKGTGISILETSHRSKEFSEIIEKAISNIRELLNIPEEYAVLFLQGGAGGQFAMIPLNFLHNGYAAYVDTGTWASRAISEAKVVGEVKVIWSGKEEGYRRIISPEHLDIPSDALYLHITSNNTIYGTQWHTFPESPIPLFVDASSDIISRPLDIKKFSIIYAGAQKNLGPAGVTLVIIKKELIQKANQNLPVILRYSTHIEKNSLYNTPPVFAIYLVKMVTDWLKNIGGIEKIYETNKQKAELLYKTIDETDFYISHIEKESRSYMNVCFRLPNEELEKLFVEEAKKNGFVGLKGHRSVGGIRVSIYNAVSLGAVEELCDFMKDFEKKNG